MYTDQGSCTDGGLISVLVYHIDRLVVVLRQHQCIPTSTICICISAKSGYIPYLLNYHAVSTNGTYGFAMSYFLITGNENNTYS